MSLSPTSLNWTEIGDEFELESSSTLGPDLEEFQEHSTLSLVCVGKSSSLLFLSAEMDSPNWDTLPFVENGRKCFF